MHAVQSSETDSKNQECPEADAEPPPDAIEGSRV